eukprot:TRINITY_DN49270_c0_g1_i1.p1 TRINITY_DN49270_c0_g1~~TRINITY_DN49270_c0_g1_i1.p1  ORF type:complete len:226 (+),score=21.57 TRINITY_DN49270_c0_g1_i1:135-812(+)
MPLLSSSVMSPLVGPPATGLEEYGHAEQELVTIADPEPRLFAGCSASAGSRQPRTSTISHFFAVAQPGHEDTLPADAFHALPQGIARRQHQASAFLFGYEGPKPEGPPVPKMICHYYPGEDPESEIVRPPPVDETVHKVKPMMLTAKLAKAAKPLYWLAYGSAVGSTAFMARRVVHGLIGPPDWGSGSPKPAEEPDPIRASLARSQSEVQRSSRGSQGSRESARS